MGIKPEEMTKINFDKTTIFKDLLLKEYENQYKNAFGELQFAFIGFMLGENMLCFEHWKKLLVLICSCEELVKKEPNIYLDFIVIFYEQLKQLPEDFFRDALTSKSFIKFCLQNLYEFIQDEKVCEKLKKRSEKFFKLLKEQFKFEPDREIEIQNYVLGKGECDEDMPQIVDLNEKFIDLK